MEIIEKHLLTMGSQKKAYKQLNTEKKWIPALKAQKTTHKQQTRKELVKVATDFYEKLYEDKSIKNDSYRKKYQTGETNEAIEPFTCEEIMKKIEKLKKEKSPGPDNIPNEALICGRHLLISHLITLFNKVLESQEIPKNWAKSRIILLYKKGDPADINNYRPISLLPCINCLQCVWRKE